MRKAIEISGWWWLTAVLAASGGVLYFAVSMASEDPYTAFTHALWHTAPGLALYIAFTMSILAASLKTALKRLTPVQVDPDAVRAMDSFIEVPAGAVDPAEWLRARGMKPLELGRGLFARSGALSILPGMVFRLGVIMFMVSLPLSGFLRSREEATLSPGGKVSMLGTEVRLQEVFASLPEDYLQVGESADFRLEGVKARLATPSGEVLAGSGLPVMAEGTYYRLTHIGYTLYIKGQDLDGSFILDILPPGKTRKLENRDIRIRLAPERTIKKGLLTGKVYNLTSPRFGILTGKGRSENIIALKAGQSGGGFETGKPVIYIKIQAVRDPALPLLKLSLTVLLAGSALMLLRPLWYERRFMAVREGGRVLIGYSEEFLKKWGVYKFRTWTEELLEAKED